MTKSSRTWNSNLAVQISQYKNPKWINEFKPEKVVVLNPKYVLFVFQGEYGRNPTRKEFKKCLHLAKKYLEKDFLEHTEVEDRFNVYIEMAVIKPEFPMGRAFSESKA